MLELLGLGMAWQEMSNRRTVGRSQAQYDYRDEYEAGYQPPLGETECGTKGNVTQ